MNTNDEKLMWKEVSTEQVIKDPYIDLRSTVYHMPDGQDVGPFYAYSRPDYVVVLATDEAGNFICVRQFRQGIRTLTTEFPAGRLEPGEDPLTAARRELREETGFQCADEDLTFLLKVPSCATVADNNAYIFRAVNCRKCTDQDLDPYEFIEIHTHTPEEISGLIRTGEFQQSVHVMAFALIRSDILTDSSDGD